jgi:hypothetical protein
MIEPEGGADQGPASPDRAPQAGPAATVEIPRAEQDAAVILFAGGEGAADNGARLQGGQLQVHDRAAAVDAIDSMIRDLGTASSGPEADLRRTYERIRERIQQAPEEQ